MQKTEAQLKNEEEVRRIMKERGYSPSSNKKKIKNTFGKNFSLQPLIAGLFMLGFLVGGWILLQNNPLESEQTDSLINETASPENAKELAEFQACLGAIDTSEIALDDADFWNKHISRYEQTISCYDSHPSATDPSEKAELQNKLAELQNSSKATEANDSAYRANMSKIDAELEQNLAKIKEESDAWDAELSKRVQERQAQSAERNTQYAKEQAEREAKQAKCDAFKTQYPDIDAYKAKNGNLDELYSNWQSAQNAYYSAINSYNAYMSKYGTQHSEEYLARLSSSLDKKRSEMNAAYSAWNSSDTSLSGEYNSKFREACL